MWMNKAAKQLTRRLVVGVSYIFLYELNLSESKGWLDELGKRCNHMLKIHEDSLIRSGAKGNESSKIIKLSFKISLLGH